MPRLTDFTPANAFPTVTILSGAATTAEIDLHGGTLLGIQFPASLTNTALKLKMSPTSGGTFANVQKDEIGGGDYTITVTASVYVPLINLAIPKGIRFLKIFGSSNEGADRTLTLAVAPV